MSPLPRLQHHDIMTIVGLFTYHQYVIYIYIYIHIHTVHTSRNVGTLRNVGALKVANLHCSWQQCVVVKWSGPSVAVRVKS